MKTAVDEQPESGVTDRTWQRQHKNQTTQQDPSPKGQIPKNLRWGDLEEQSKDQSRNTLGSCNLAEVRGDVVKPSSGKDIKWIGRGDPFLEQGKCTTGMNGDHPQGRWWSFLSNLPQEQTWRGATPAIPPQERNREHGAAVPVTLHRNDWVDVEWHQSNMAAGKPTWPGMRWRGLRGRKKPCHCSKNSPPKCMAWWLKLRLLLNILKHDKTHGDKRL